MRRNRKRYKSIRKTANLHSIRTAATQQNRKLFGVKNLLKISLLIRHLKASGWLFAHQGSLMYHFFTRFIESVLRVVSFPLLKNFSLLISFPPLTLLLVRFFFTPFLRAGAIVV